jgi:hypothetical protein
VNCPKYDQKVEVCHNQNDKTWKAQQVCNGVDTGSLNDLICLHELKEIPLVPGGCPCCWQGI